MAEKSSEEYLKATNCCVNKEEIKNLRKTSNMKLEQVSKISGVTKVIVWKMESYSFGMQLCQFKRLIETYGLQLKVVDSNGNEYNGILKDDNGTILD